MQEWQGRHYCRAHLPLEAPTKIGHGWMDAFTKARLAALLTNFEGVQWPGGMPQTWVTYHLGGIAPNLRHCRFSQNTNFVVQTQDADFTESEFLGETGLKQLRGGFRCQNSVFRGRTLVQTDAGAGIDFTGSTFKAQIEFQYVDDAGSVALDRCTFHRAPKIVLRDKKARLPQGCTFIKARFEESAQQAADEPTYRTIRNLFYENRAREWEGYFYALEKRCHRLSIPKWPPNHWIARFVSKMYDLSSAYGQSYERALLVFLAVQGIFGIGYWLASGDATWGGEFDSRPFAFTAAQAIKPFELLSGRTPDSWFYELMPTDAGGRPSGWWTFWTSMHSAVSLTLIALFLIAVRWRFRRE